jgi:hypothetical protein
MPDPITPENERPVEHIGTLFPSLDGTTPGEAESQEDITGQPLESLNEGADNEYVENILNQPAADATGKPLPAGANVVDVAGAEIEKPKARRGRSVQDRFNILTRNLRGTQDENSELKAELSKLTELVMKQDQKFSATPAPRPASLPGEQSVFQSDPTGEGNSAAGGAATQPFSLDDVRSAVREEISTYDKQLRDANAAQAELTTQQEESLQLALQEFPELADQRSRAHQVYRELYLKSSLRTLPDAPYQIALQVRGMLADEATNSAATVERKKQAGVVTPQPTNTGAVAGGGANVNALKKEMSVLAAEMKQGNNDYRVYRRWRLAREQLKQAQQK